MIPQEVFLTFDYNSVSEEEEEKFCLTSNLYVTPRDYKQKYKYIFMGRGGGYMNFVVNTKACIYVKYNSKLSPVIRSKMT